MYDEFDMQRMTEKYSDVFNTKNREEGLEYFKTNYRCTQDDIGLINAIYDRKEEENAMCKAVGDGFKSVWG